jgi:hypothetical protein
LQISLKLSSPFSRKLNIWKRTPDCMHETVDMEDDEARLRSGVLDGSTLDYWLAGLNWAGWRETEADVQ